MKEQRHVLTPELRKKLSEDGACFDLDHEKQIEKLKEEILAKEELLKTIEKEWQAKNDQAQAEHSKRVKELEIAVASKDEELQSKDEVIGSYIAEMLEKDVRLVRMKDEIAKELRKEQKCFDPFHKMTQGMDRESFTISELFSFAGAIFTHSLRPHSSASIYSASSMMPTKVTVMLDPFLREYVASAKNLAASMNARLLKDAIDKEKASEKEWFRKMFGPEKGEKE